MLKKILAVILCISASMILVSNSFAADKDDGVYTVAFAGSTKYVGTFNLDQKPWLFIKSTGDLNLIPRSKWFDSVDDKFKNTQTLANEKGFWLSFSDNYWSDIVKHGQWRIKALEGKGQDKNRIGSAHFIVTPEPIGSALFMIGAGALGIIKRRRNKNKVQ